MNEKDQEDFDLYAKNYREIHTKNVQRISGADSYYFAEYKVLILKQYEENKKIRVLDVGCGDGATALYFLKHFPAFEITGIDVSEESIAVAAARKLANAAFSVYSGNNFPFADETFDLVFIAGVLHHIDTEKHATLIAEVKRVLKCGGTFYLFEHNPLNPFTQYLVKTCVFDKDARLIFASALKKKLLSAGFNISKTAYTIFFPRSWFFKPFLTIEKYLQDIPLGGQYFIRAVKY